MSETDVARPLRADARRNRERILQASRHVFAERGLQTQMDDVAAKAGVGVGTVYRHFPTKDALLTAIVAEKFERITQFALEALEEPRAWPAFVRMLERGAEIHAADAAMQQTLLLASTTVWETARSQFTDLDAAAAELVARAIAEGEMRTDFHADDIGLMMCGVVATMARGVGDWRRHLEIIVDGIRAR